MKTKILEFLKSNQAKTFYWTTLNGFLALMTGMLVVVQPDVIDPKLALLASASIAGLNALTKYINKTYM